LHIFENSLYIYIYIYIYSHPFSFHTHAAAWLVRGRELEGWMDEQIVNWQRVRKVALSACMRLQSRVVFADLLFV
jgi:hypothetical protein